MSMNRFTRRTYVCIPDENRMTIDVLNINSRLVEAETSNSCCGGNDRHGHVAIDYFSKLSSGRAGGAEVTQTETKLEPLRTAYNFQLATDPHLHHRNSM